MTEYASVPHSLTTLQRIFDEERFIRGGALDIEARVAEPKDIGNIVLALRPKLSGFRYERGDFVFFSEHPNVEEYVWPHSPFLNDFERWRVLDLKYRRGQKQYAKAYIFRDGFVRVEHDGEPGGYFWLKNPFIIFNSNERAAHKMLQDELREGVGFRGSRFLTDTDLFEKPLAWPNRHLLLDLVASYYHLFEPDFEEIGNTVTIFSRVEYPGHQAAALCWAFKENPFLDALLNEIGPTGHTVEVRGCEVTDLRVRPRSLKVQIRRLSLNGRERLETYGTLHEWATKLGHRLPPLAAHAA